MLITLTTDKIEVILSSSITTNQLDIISSYNEYTSTGVTPTKTVTTTNNTTAVSLVPAPTSGGTQRSLRYAHIFNTDSVSAVVTIRTNYNGTIRNVISVTLQVNEYLQYTHRTGWKVFDSNGGLKNFTGYYDLSDARNNEQLLSANGSTNVTLSTTPVCIYMGKATGSYSWVEVLHYIGGAGGSITWAELAIYKGTPSLGSTTTATRVGFADTSASWLTQTNQYRFTTIAVTGVTAGDDLWVVFAVSAVTNPQPRSHTIADDIGAGFIGTTTAGTRPSTSSTITITPSTTQVQPFIGWMGL
jgi:hypothetical protein